MRSVTDGFRVLVAHVLGVVEEDMGWEGAEHCSCLQVRLGTEHQERHLEKPSSQNLMEDSAGWEPRSTLQRSQN